MTYLLRATIIKNTLSILLLIVSINIKAQITFEKVYEFTTVESCKANAVVEANNENFVIAGEEMYPRAISLGGPPIDVHNNLSAGWVFLVNNKGDTIWTREFHNTFFKDIIITRCQNYVSAGYFRINDTSAYDIKLAKLNNDGDTIWSRIYGTPNNDDLAHSIHETKDSGYIAAGYTSIYNLDSTKDIFLMKTDINGEVLWHKTYGGTEIDIANAVQQTKDGRYLIAGRTNSYGEGNSDVYLVKTDTNGDTLWTETYGGTKTDIANAVQQTKDGGYIIAGRTYSYGEGSSDVYLVKTDTNGNTLWHKTYGGTEKEAANAVHQTKDGGYIIAGRTNSYGEGKFDVYLVKTNTNGDTLWTETYGGAEVDVANAVQQTKDGGYIIAGYTYSGQYLIKTDNTGNIQYINKKYDNNNKKYFVHPNPCPGIFKISAPKNSGGYSVKIINPVGKTVYKEQYTGLQNEINIKEYPKGIYIVQIGTGEENFNRKVVYE